MLAYASSALKRGVVGHIHQGATFTVIPRRLARTLGIRQLRRSVSVRLADGRQVKLGAAVAIVQIKGRGAPVTVLVGDVSEPILGVEALEAPSRSYAVRLGGCR